MRGDFGGGDLSQLVAEQINNFRPLEYDQPVHSTDRTVYGLDGEVVRVRMPDAHQLVLVTDVTKRKHAERALRDRSAMVELLYQVASDANAAGSVEEALTGCMERIGQFTGWPLARVFLASRVADSAQGELRSTDLWYQTVDHDFSSLKAELDGIAVTPGVGIVGQVWSSRHAIWNELSDLALYDPLHTERASSFGLTGAFAFPILSAGKVVAVIEFVGIDVATLGPSLVISVANLADQIARVFERDTAGQVVVAARDLAEAATTAEGNFLAVMSHEIRTPMTGLIGMVDLLTQTPLDDEQARMLHTISDSGYALLTIINDILYFSKIEANRMELEYVPMSIADCVEGAAATLAPTAGRKGIEIVTYVDPALRNYLRGDPVRLRQILFNLGGNAVKFSGRNSVVTIEAEAVDLDTGDGTFVILKVSDKGIGIPKHAYAGLFQAFTQVEASTTRRFGGTGLGLSICKRWVDMMHGEISVRSEVGVGSEFTVRIPFEDVRAITAIDTETDLSGLDVLVATDHVVRGRSCHDALVAWGAQVAVVPNNDEVEAIAEARYVSGRPFHVVVLADASSPTTNVSTRLRF